MASRGSFPVFAAAVLLLLTISVIHADQDKSLQRFRRATPIVHEIYAFDHFIELVEKIEKNFTNILSVATYIRQLGYKDDYWTTLLGTALPLPDGILSYNEKSVLSKMVAHRYSGSRELGVVRLPSGETVAIGHVINGICAGLNRYTELSLASWAPGATRTVDNLYAATLARDLAETALAKGNTPSNSYFGPGGSWDSESCPGVYTRTSNGITSEASYAELMGDVDGLLLGAKLPRWARKGVRLGQLLRMYYTTGVCYDESFASCLRYVKFKDIDDPEGLYGQVRALAEAIYLKNPKSYPNVKKEDIKQISKTTVENAVKYLDQGNKTCPKKEEGCELPANLIFVMDESGSINRDSFVLEKTFVSQIIDAFNISPRQTNVAIVEFATNAAIDINIHDYGSKTRLRCAVSTLQKSKGWTHTAKALNLVKNDIFLPLQNKNKNTESDISNILILLTDGESNDKDGTALPRVVRELKRDIKDLTMISVGVGNINMDELRLIATDPAKHVFTAKDFTALLQLVKKLQKRTCTTPIQMNIDFTQNENNTIVTAFVWPGSVRYFALDSANFFGVGDILIAIKPIFGSISIYASRTNDTPGPKNYEYKLDPIPLGLSMNVHIPNPCGGFNKTDCPPVYLAIYANDPNCACTEPDCVVPGQIKFTIQKGVSGTTQIQASILLLLFSLISRYFF